MTIVFFRIHISTFLFNIANNEGITLSDNVYPKDLFVYMQIVSGSFERTKTRPFLSPSLSLSGKCQIENKQTLLSQLLEIFKKIFY